MRWRVATAKEHMACAKLFSRTAMRRGVWPNGVYIGKGLVAFRYDEPTRYERWGVRHRSEAELKKSWSAMMALLRPLIGDKNAVEIYPREIEIVNTAPTRWFWVLPGDIPPQMNLNPSSF